MSECFHDKFILNGDVVDCSQFNDNLINKGLSVYEVLRVIRGRYLFLEDHINRLEASIKIFNVIYKPDIKLIIEYLLKYKMIIGVSDGNVKVVINYSNTSNNNPQIFVYQINHSYPSIQEYSNGITTSLTYGKRTAPNAKFINVQIKNLVVKKLSDSTFYETFFVDDNDQITEGSRSNVFFIRSERVITSPDEKVLHGITRKHVIEICKELKINLIYQSVHVKALSEYDAVFLTGTSAKVLPVRQIDNNAFDVQNAIMQKIMKAFDKKIITYINGK